jgi:hypothetical protein
MYIFPFLTNLLVFGGAPPKPLDNSCSIKEQSMCHDEAGELDDHSRPIGTYLSSASRREVIGNKRFFEGRIFWLSLVTSRHDH